MAEDRIQLQVITAGGIQFDKMVSYVSLPLEGGSVGVLSNHAPLLAAVIDGTVKCDFEGNKTQYIYVGTGVVDVFENKVIMLVRAAECAENIDLARAQAAEKRANERIQSKSSDVDMIRAESSLHRALAREKTYGLWKNEH